MASPSSFMIMDFVKSVFGYGTKTDGSESNDGADKPSSSSTKPLVEERKSEWAKDNEEEDRIEKLIRDSGCWDHHIAVVECMIAHGDWRKCQAPLDEFRICMGKSSASKKSAFKSA